MKTLWSTVVGSHMWKMNHPGSDLDIFTCHIVPTKAILMGANVSHSIETKANDIDMTSHEIGKVVYMIAQGNVNYIWGLTSPEIIKEDDTPWRQKLADIFRRNMSKNCFHSIHGLAIHNYKDYVDKPKIIDQKRLRIIYRTIDFGLKILNSHKIIYEPIDIDITPKMLTMMIVDLEDAYDKSDLPDRPDGRDYDRFLYEIRICELNGLL